MTIYLVTAGEYSDYGVLAVFTTKPGAEHYVREVNRQKNRGYDARIEEWEADADAEAEKVARTAYRCELVLESGDVLHRWAFEVLADPHARGGVIEKLCWRHGHQETPGVVAESFESADHALKLAAEARQRWLRTGTVVPADV